MSVPVSCCNPCPTVEVTNVPGIEGPPGTDGTNGIDAFSTTTADFIVPAIGNIVTVSVVNSLWMAPGQNVWVQDAGVFLVINHGGGTDCQLLYRAYTGNTAAGVTIPAGNQISPAGTQPDVTLIPFITTYQTGGSQSLTNSSVQLLGSSVVLNAGPYLLMATYRLDYSVATFASPDVIQLKLRETFNGPADITNAVVNLNTPTTTAKTGTFIQGALPPVRYTAAQSDTVEMYGIITSTPYSGALQVVELSIVAIPLF